jgi:hypothetical protein
MTTSGWARRCALLGAANRCRLHGAGESGYALEVDLPGHTSVGDDQHVKAPEAAKRLVTLRMLVGGWRSRYSGTDLFPWLDRTRLRRAALWWGFLRV